MHKKGKIMKQKAFTLIELMIVIAIIAFLATISVPQFFKYQVKAKQAEVAVMLASLHTALQAYYTEHGKYTSVLNGEGGVGWKPDGYKGGGEQERFNYTYGFYFPGAQEGVHYFTGKLNTPANLLSHAQASENAFIVKAAGNIGSRGCDIWSMDEARNLQHEQNGAS